MRDRNMLQAVAFGMVSLPPYPEQWSPETEREIARQRVAIKSACIRAAHDLGWNLKRQLGPARYECWRPGMQSPWVGVQRTAKELLVDNEQWHLQQCCRLIVKKSLLNEEGT